MFARCVKIGFLLLWLLVGSLFYLAAWVRNADLFPPFPDFLDVFYPFLPDGQEKFLIEYMGALFYVSIFTLLAFAGYRVYKHFKKPK